MVVSYQFIHDAHNTFQRKCMICKQKCRYINIILPFTKNDNYLHDFLHNSSKIRDFYIDSQLVTITKNQDDLLYVKKYA